MESRVHNSMAHSIIHSLHVWHLDNSSLQQIIINIITQKSYPHPLYDLRLTYLELLKGTQNRKVTCYARERVNKNKLF